MTDMVLLERRYHIAFITLNRPDKGNVLDHMMSDALVRVIDIVTEDSSLRAVLLQAAGPRFCVGGAIEGFVEAGPRMAEMLAQQIPPIHAAIQRLAQLPLPVVSAVNGPVGGGGIGLALCADIVLAAESMKLRGGYSAIGLTPDLGGSWFLTRLVGPMMAKRILFANESWSSQQCLAAGIVSEVHADDVLSAEAQAFVRFLAQSATGSLGHIKRLVDGAAQRTLGQQLELECRCMIESGSREDAQEGVRAFAEKRTPRFGLRQ